MEEKKSINGEHFYDIEIAGSMERLSKLFQTKGEFPPVNAATLEAMYDYLTQKVKFPFQGEIAALDENPPGRQIVNVTVNGVFDPDDTDELNRYGLVCEVFNGKETFHMPLSEIVIKQEDASFQFVEDYCVWYWEVKEGHGDEPS
ncbi:MAG: calcium-binding protein [Leptospirales bacterium]